MGIQQCAHQTKGPMKGSLHHSTWAIQIKHYVFWNMQLSSHFPGLHGRSPWRLYCRGLVGNLHGRHTDPLLGSENTQQMHLEGSSTLLWTGNVLKLERCTFLAEEVEYLRMIVGKGGIQMDPVKLKAIQEWSPPANIKVHGPSLDSAASTESSSPFSLTLLTPSWISPNSQTPGSGDLIRRVPFRTCKPHLSNNQSSLSPTSLNPSSSWQMPCWWCYA